MSTLDEFFPDGKIPESDSLYDPDCDAQYDTGEHKLNMARRRVLENSDLSGQEKQQINEFDRQLKRINHRKNNRSARTRALYVDIARLLQVDSELLLLTVAEGESGEKAVDDLVAWVQEQGYTGNYIHKLLITIKIYGELMGSDDVQSRFDPIKPGRFRDDDQTPLPGNVVEWHDAVAMAMTRPHLRDRALILSEWGLGARPDSELLWLQYKHLEWMGDHYRVTLPWDGKTGERTIRLFPGAAILRRWIEQEHPVHGDPEAALGPETFVWTKLRSNKRLEYPNMYRIFTQAGEDAEIGKDTNAQHFRRSRASFLAGKPTVSEAELREHFGWSFDSNSPKHYITKFRTDIDRNIAMADGASVKSFEKTQNVAPIECDGCGQWTERYVDNCVCCGAEVDEDLHEYHFEVSDPSTDGKTTLQLLQELDISVRDIEALPKLRPIIKNEGASLWDKIEMLKGAVKGFKNGKNNSWAGIGGLAAYASGCVIGAGQRGTEAWLRAKHTAMSIHPDFEYYPRMPLKRFVAFATVVTTMTTIMITLFWLNGAISNLAAGDLTEWSGLLFSLAFGKWLFDRGFPTVEEAQDAAAEE